MAVDFANTVFSAAQSTTGLYIGNTFTGTSLLSGATPVTINGTISTPGSVVQVSINLGGVTTTGAAGTYLGFSAAAGGDYVYYFQVTAASLVTPVTIGITGAAALPLLSVGVAVTTTNIPAPIGPLTPCYAEGTLIRTTRGDVAVEALAVGDEVVTASGAHRPIVWLGHRRTDCTGHPAPETVQPIRVRAGAVAPGMPARDLRVSPDHALFFDDVLVQARFLVNGSTIVRDAVASVTYWHVELESHDVLIAENMPSESYLDVGNRRAFDAGSVIALHPVFDQSEAEAHCAPLVIDGERLVAIRTWLAERARHLGVRSTADAAVQVLADGLVLTPTTVGEGRFVYAVPPGVADLRLRSRAAIQREIDATGTDVRRLGLCVTALEVDGVDMSLDDDGFSTGWYESEGGFRWTDGDAVLPAARTLAISAHGLPAYPVTGPRLCETRPLEMEAYRMVG